MDVSLPDIPGSLPSFRISHLPVSHCDFQGLPYLKVPYITIYLPALPFFGSSCMKNSPRDAMREQGSKTGKGRAIKEYVT